MEITDEKEIALIIAWREENRVKMETAKRRAELLREAAKMIEAGVSYYGPAIFEYVKKNSVAVDKETQTQITHDLNVIYDSIVSILPERK